MTCVNRSRSPWTSGRAGPTAPAPGAPSARFRCTTCRRATAHALQARTSSSGCTTRKKVPRSTRLPGGRSRRTIRSRPSWAGSANGRARPACNRAELDSAVGINAVERFLGDEAIAQGWRLPEPSRPSGRRVLVVGAGPAGLSAAYQLRLKGHEVEIHEAGAQPGGMMRFGIPTFRLPRDVLDAEIARLLELGITLRLNTQVTDLTGTMRA